jgi:UDP-N-acetylglucosamine 2-epimerase (non-hydrolysing)
VKLAIVLGTRPEIVKMAPVIRECIERRLDHFVLHTGQHYAYELDRVFFEQLGLHEPAYNLNVGSGLHGEQTGRMLQLIEKTLLAERPDVVLFQGDTNSVLAGALAATKLRIRTGHVEAGLRSGDRAMPEETNRVVADHVSDLLFAPTEASARTLRSEGLPAERVFVTGNTVVDALLQHRDLARGHGDPVLERLPGAPREFLLMTAHRQENVDDPHRLRQLVEGARRAGERLGLPVIYPLHPRARKRLDEFGVDASGLHLLAPLDYLAFVDLQARARVVLTDSGGVQEEACVLGIPCVTLRDTTERPETLATGGNVLVGADAHRIAEAAESMASRRGQWTNPLGDGTAARRILDTIQGRRSGAPSTSLSGGLLT